MFSIHDGKVGRRRKWAAVEVVGSLAKLAVRGWRSALREGMGWTTNWQLEELS